MTGRWAQASLSSLYLGEIEIGRFGPSIRDRQLRGKIKDMIARAVSAVSFLVLTLLITAVGSQASAQNRDNSFGSTLKRSGPNSEVIRMYDVTVDVQKTSALVVTERIEIYAGGRLVRRGIYRDFPTVYYRWYGAVRVPFKVLSVTRNGADEPWRTVERSNGVRLFIGNSDRNVPQGWQAYEIKYRTDLQLGHFNTYDELYWNAIGTGWLFPILNAKVTVILPAGAQITRTRALVGRQGARGDQAASGAQISTSSNSVLFRRNATLSAGYGLTIVVQWQKGVVTPASRRGFGRFIGDNPDLAVAIAGALILALYYLIAWLLVGRDPRRGRIHPQYQPPEGFSPAACRFVMKMGFDHRVMAAAILNMAVKGFLTIREKNEKHYVLEKSDDSVGSLSGGEKALAQVFFGAKGKRTHIRQSNHAKLQRAIGKLKDKLSSEYEKAFFRRNRWQHWIGIGMAVVFTLITAILSPGETGFILIWLAMWSFAVCLIALRAAMAWRAGSYGTAVAMTALALAFAGAEVFVLLYASENSSYLTLAATIVMGMLIIIFHQAMKARTGDGRRVMDEIEGFRLFLSSIDENRDASISPPNRTPALFERFLPYALALDVESKWASQFTDVLTGAAASNQYEPFWYYGVRFSQSGLDRFMTDFSGNFSTAIASSSTAPGSSSGGGSGGSVGGGGGGGGGGGW